MKLPTMLIPVSSTALALLLSCGGGKVVVLPAPVSATPVASNYVAPAPSSVVVTTVPLTPAPVVGNAIESQPRPRLHSR